MVFHSASNDLGLDAADDGDELQSVENELSSLRGRALRSGDIHDHPRDDDVEASPAPERPQRVPLPATCPM